MQKDYIGIHSTDFCNTQTGELLMLSYLELQAFCMHINKVKYDHYGYSDVRLQLCLVCQTTCAFECSIVQCVIPNQTAPVNYCVTYIPLHSVKWTPNRSAIAIAVIDLNDQSKLWTKACQ